MKRYFSFFILITLITIPTLHYSEHSTISNNEPNLEYPIYFILDCSETMKTQSIGNTVSKLELAKQILTKTVKEYQFYSGISFGLIVYGAFEGATHEKPTDKDCLDVTTLNDIGTLNYENVNKVLDPLKPTGWTPLATALEQSLLKYPRKYLDRVNVKPSVIVLTDGRESCGKDPCNSVKLLTNSGVTSTVPFITVGFDLTEDDKKVLNCISKETGGAFIASDQTKKNDNCLDLKWLVIDAPEEYQLEIAINGIEPDQLSKTIFEFKLNEEEQCSKTIEEASKDIRVQAKIRFNDRMRFKIFDKFNTSRVLFEKERTLEGLFVDPEQKDRSFVFQGNITLNVKLSRTR